MKKYTLTPIKVLSFLLFISILFSCSKDSDLLVDYIIIDPEAIIDSSQTQTESEVSINLDNGTFETNEDNIALFSISDITANTSGKSPILKNIVQPINGQVIVEKDSIVKYFPNADFNGSDSFILNIEITDENNSVTETELSLDVVVNPMPDSVNDTLRVDALAEIGINVLNNDTYTNKNNVSISKTSSPSYGSTTINEDKSIIYSPVSESDGDTFTYTTIVENSDGSFTTEEASVVIIKEDNAAKQDAVSLQSYGAVGDGVTDDTAAIQNAFDNETSIISDAGKTYLVSSTIRLDQDMAQIIDFNGSTITRNSTVGYLLWIDKSPYANSLTTISNLEIDGRDFNGSLVYSESRIHFTNVHIHHAKGTSGGLTVGLYITPKNEPGSEGQWVLDNVNMNNISHTQTTTGEAEALYVYWPVTVTNGVQFVYKNSTIHDVWGRESNIMILTSALNDISYTNNSLWFENMLLYNFARRAVKNYIGNTTWINSDFYMADYTNPNYDNSVETVGEAAIFDIGAASSALGSENNLVCGCNFYGGYTEPLNGGNRPFQILATGGNTSVDIMHSTFNGDAPNNGKRIGWNGISIWTLQGDQYKINEVKICDCDFTLGSTAARGNMIGDLGGFAMVGPKLQIDSNNTYAIGQTAALSKISSSKYDVVDLSGDCPTCPSIDD